jgi:hypothetical protein
MTFLHDIEVEVVARQLQPQTRQHLLMMASRLETSFLESAEDPATMEPKKRLSCLQ